MIRKLRIKLIAVSMLSLLLVLLLIMGAVNIVNYQEILTEADGILTILSDNGGTFPKRGEAPPALDSLDGPQPHSPELPYESRYFSVALSGDGAVTAIDTGKIAAVDTSEAARMAEYVWESAKEKGFLGDYRYIRSDGEEQTLVIFLDCGRSLDTFRTFLFASGGISLLGLLSVFGLMVLFSGRIIKPIAESYQKQKQFITDAGHEIKTPITIINADAEVLSMEVGENEWLRDIQLQTKRLARLTNDLVYLSRMQEEQAKLTMLEFPFSDLVSDTAQSFQALAKVQGKGFSVRIQPQLSVYGDENALRQLISILLDNAVKYTDPGGSIALSAEKRGKTTLLAVENTTSAPLPEDLDSLFLRFYRADPSRNSQTGGHGLGLSIAKAIVETHKGRIEVAREGGALRITASLPA